MSLPVTPPANGALISGTVGGHPRDYEVKFRGDHFELLTRLDSGTWLCDQERFDTWGTVVGFFHYLRLLNVDYVPY